MLRTALAACPWTIKYPLLEHSLPRDHKPRILETQRLGNNPCGGPETEAEREREVGHEWRIGWDEWEADEATGTRECAQSEARVPCCPVVHGLSSPRQLLEGLASGRAVGSPPATFTLRGQAGLVRARTSSHVNNIGSKAETVTQLATRCKERVTINVL